jgi:hypothetical protein
MRTLWWVGGAFVLGCSSSSGGGAGSKNDAGTPDVAVHITLPDAGHHDAGHDAGHDAAVTREAGHDAARDAARESSTLDAASDALASTTYPAAHPAMPQVANAGGPVMTSPKFVIITFTGDTLAPGIDDFAQ